MDAAQRIVEDLRDGPTTLPVAAEHIAAIVRALLPQIYRVSNSGTSVTLHFATIADAERYANTIRVFNDAKR